MQAELRKIVMYIDVMHRGGAQRVMANLANDFAAGGVEVVLVNDAVPQPGVPTYPVAQTVRRRCLRQDFSGNVLAKNIERITVLRKILQEEDPDIALSFLGRCNKRLLLAAAGLPCKKIVSVRNDPDREYGRSAAQKWVTNRLFATADGCVFQTREAARYFSSAIQKKSKIIMNPVAAPFFEAQRPAQGRNIISVGRLEPQKNQALLIEAFAAVAGQFPEQNLVIYGEGTLRPALQQQIEALGLRGRVLLPGDEKDIREKLAQSSLFVLSSDYEGMPNALLEALAVGLPCIATDCPCGGPAQVIESGTNGVLVPCRDAPKMAQAMRALLADPQRCAALSAAAKRSAEAFRADTVFADWKEYFASILHS